MKKIMYILGSGILLILAVGMYRFNFTNEDIHVEQSNGAVVRYSEQTEIKESKKTLHKTMNQSEHISKEKYKTTNEITDLIVITAPSVDDIYYKKAFDEIIAFDIAYANTVIGRDEIRILVDAKTRKYFEGKVPEDILIDANVADIWMRDFTTINPRKPVQFRYTPVSFENDQHEADYIQKSFNSFTKKISLSYPKTEYFLDGGNIVDNYAGRVITTTRFLEDNNLSKKEGIETLKKLLDTTEVAIIPPDDDILAHSDGMVMFANEHTLFVNEYDEPFRSEILDELTQAFPGIEIIEITANWDGNAYDANIASACGINLNAVVTSNYIYMPHFDDVHSDNILTKIQQHTSKKVVPIPAQGVCAMGGSVRCLSWQQSGKQAKKVLELLSEDSEINSE